MAKIPKKLADLGFEVIDKSVTPRLILALSGRDKQGKTHFSFTAPGPIAYFGIDIGDEGVINKFADKIGYRMPLWIPRVHAEAMEMWDKLETGYMHMLNGSDVRTIILDTATELRELAGVAEYGKAPANSFMYAAVNARLRKLLKAALSSDKNVIALYKMNPIYLNDQRTKDYEMAGGAGAEYIVQINAQIWRDDPWDDGEGNITPGTFHLYIENCRQNADLQGADLEGPLCNFQSLAMMALPDVDPEVWE